nr:small ribosomal subunit protein uS11m isoform X3 [Anolis sagrei ordinatus]
MIPALATARRGLLGSCSVALSRSIQTGIRRLQELAEDSVEEAEATNKSDFSFFPPAPGKENSLRWAGKKFEEIPVAHIKATYNNTHIQVLSPENVPLALSTCGTEGFKNAKKATAIAAQTTGIAAATAAIKGLTMGGLEVISITDDTPIPHNGCRPRKARRL